MAWHGVYFVSNMPLFNAYPLFNVILVQPAPMHDIAMQVMDQYQAHHVTFFILAYIIGGKLKD